MPTLFLDRDGVLNVRPPGDYVRRPDDWIPLPGVGEALRLLAPYFRPILVVTNQAGIGKGLMTEADLAAVHAHMLDYARASGGRLDGVYYCPHRADAGCTCRKPATGMALQARADFPGIDFPNAWMVGDSASDIEMGLALVMHTVLIAGKFEEADLLAELPVDYRFDNLLEFARFISGK